MVSPHPVGVAAYLGRMMDAGTNHDASVSPTVHVRRAKAANAHNIAGARGNNMTWLQTATGKAFPLLTPQPGDIDIDDIAHALSMMCRYNGHCIEFYSVAEHCCHISDYCDDEHKLWGLLHDASEAYITDIPRPLKPFLDNYYEHETRIMRVICKRFGLNLIMPEAVKELDARILNNEREQNMLPAPQPWDYTGERIDGLMLRCWNHHRAKYEFLSRFHKLHDNQ
jgi:uncharacterized protein